MIAALGTLGQEYHRLDESDRADNLGKELTFCFEILDDLKRAYGIEHLGCNTLIDLHFDSALTMAVSNCASFLAIAPVEQKQVAEEYLNRIWRLVAIAAIRVGR
jgi:hypothetical protein